jgi:stearoyl-CoA desaturase (delta-9 desaturase)
MKQGLWVVSSAQYLGFLGIALGYYAITTMGVSAYWLIASVIGHLYLACCVSVVLHRYYAHNAFTVPRWLEPVLAVSSVLPLQTGPIAWVTTHMGHHAFSDTERDTTVREWRCLLWREYRAIPKSFAKRVIRRMRKWPWAVIAHRYSMLIALAFMASLYLISWKLLVFGYIIPLGTLSVAFGLHEHFAHWNKRPHNVKYAELILNTGGEWMHVNHHEHGGRASFGGFDLGYQVIKLIAVPGSIR